MRKNSSKPQLPELSRSSKSKTILRCVLLCDYLAVTPDLRSISSCALFSKAFELLCEDELSLKLFEEEAESEPLESLPKELLLEDSDAEPSWLKPLVEFEEESLVEKLLLAELLELPERLLLEESLLPLEELSQNEVDWLCGCSFSSMKAMRLKKSVSRQLLRGFFSSNTSLLPSSAFWAVKRTSCGCGYYLVLTSTGK